MTVTVQWAWNQHHGQVVIDRSRIRFKAMLITTQPDGIRHLVSSNAPTIGVRVRVGWRPYDDATMTVPLYPASARECIQPMRELRIWR